MKLFNSTRVVGSNYENMALTYLIRQGMKPVARNFNCRGGELDLIMKDKEAFVFIEVKYRKDQYHGHAAEAVTPTKKKRLIKASTVWLLKNNYSLYDTEFRFDVIAIHDEGKHIEWFKNAITQD
ncbi:YraN family protein [Vibrio salinus]|uniref:YraN family protein n=1 Tax=Vibrio salinus TaxID=2899784 RepID=UPI001E4159B6|nr:YraN family protein [Vibrio salinus]MCE0494237.1 YraN family protein [Vibrio salinus]